MSESHQTNRLDVIGSGGLVVFSYSGRFLESIKALHVTHWMKAIHHKYECHIRDSNNDTGLASYMCSLGDA